MSTERRDPIALVAAILRLVRQAQPSLPAGARYLVFSCPSCGSPSPSTVELEVDIHSGAVYTCDQCQVHVAFTAETATRGITPLRVADIQRRLGVDVHAALRVQAALEGKGDPA